MKNLIYGLILVLAGAMLCLPGIAYGQNKKTIVRIDPPKLIKYTKPVRKKSSNSANADSRVKSKRKKPRLRRKADLSKIRRVISVTKPQ